MEQYFDKPALSKENEDLSFLDLKLSIRVLGIAILLHCLFYVSFEFSPVRITYYITYWAILFTLFWLITTLVSSQMSPDQLPKYLIVMNQYLLTLCLPANAIVTTLFWPFAYKDALKHIEYVGQPRRVFHLYEAHVSPTLFCLLNLYITEIRLEYSMYKVWLLCCFSYTAFSFFYVKILKFEPPYKQLTWKD